MQDSYDFSYDVEWHTVDEDGDPDVEYTTVDVSVHLETERPRRYQIDYFVHNTSTTDLQAVAFDVFHEAYDRLLTDLAADGVEESMLIEL